MEQDKKTANLANQKNKLSPHQAQIIRRLYSTNMVGLRELAKNYGVCISSVRQVIKNISYFDPAYIPPSQNTKERTPRIIGGRYL